MATVKTKLFKICIIYFKPSGKFYSEGMVEMECIDCGPPGHPSCYMQDAVDWIKDCRDDGRTLLPGLSGVGWDGPILLDCEQGFPVLILPKERTDG